MSDRQIVTLARAMVLVLTLGALLLSLYTSMDLVSLLLLGFAGIAQLFPGVVLGLFSGRVTTAGVFAGMVSGICVAVFLIATGRDPYHGLNAGFLALCSNFAVTGTVSLLTTVRVAGFEDSQPEFAMAPAPSGFLEAHEQ